MRILLLEDNADLATMLRDVLEWRGHHVLYGRSADEGLTLLKASDPLPRVILSDLHMPDMDGHELIRLLRANPEWTHIKVVLMSASITLRQADDAAADAYLIKPFSMSSLQDLLTSFDTPAET